MMPLVYVIAKRRSYKVYKRPTWKELTIAFKIAFLLLLTPVILLVKIFFKVVTPTEAAVLAIVYAIVLGKLIYKEYSLKDLFLDTITILLVMVPMVIPAAKEARIDLVHFGVTGP